MSGIYLNFGEMMGMEDVWRRTFTAVDRGLELLPGHAPLLLNGYRAALITGDLERARRYGERYVATAPDREATDAVRWSRAHLLRDQAEIERMVRRLDSIPAASLVRIVFWALENGGDVPEAQRAMERQMDRATTPGERSRALFHQHYWSLAVGRPAAAHRATQSMVRMGSGDPELRELAYRLRVLAALYSVGDSSAARDAVHRLADRADGPLLEDAPGRALQYEAICVVGQWRLWGGDTESAADFLHKLTMADPLVDAPGAATRARACATLLEAIRAYATGAPDIELRIGQLETVMRSAPLPSGWSYGNLALARLLEGVGNYGAALDAAFRRPHLYYTDVYIASHLLEEARLAELLGDRERAVRAYRHYMALHYDPEPDLRQEVERVRSRLRALQVG